METLAHPVSTSRHQRISVTTTKPTEFIDITDTITSVIAACHVHVGLVNIQTLHTTTAIVVNEHEPLLLTDFESMLDSAAPARTPYWHDDVRRRIVNLTANERVNGHAHCRALLLGPSVCLNIVEGQLLLGRWQRVFLVELDGPQERHLSVLMAAGSAR